MARLRVSKNGNQVQELELEASQTYLGGRADNCQIKMDPEPGISRQHFQISCTEGHWKLEVLSRYGELYVNGEKSSGLELISGSQFKTPPYEFQFLLEATKSSAKPVADEQSVASDSQADLSGATRVASIQGMPVLIVLNDRDERQNIYKLDGDSWIGGRDANCAIHLDTTKSSRQHFEIKLKSGKYFIRDLGSSNGTVVNGHRIAVDDWALLQSGDKIGISNWTLNFEIRDASFQERVDAIPEEMRHTPELDGLIPGPPSDEAPPDSADDLSSASYSQTNYEDKFGDVPGAETWQEVPPQAPEWNAMPPPNYDLSPTFVGAYPKSKKILTPVRVLILAILLAGGLYYFFQDASPEVKDVKAVKSKVPFDALTPEDQQFVKRAYGNAKQELMSQRYAEALQEITRMKEKIPIYEDSREIEKFANEGISRLEQFKKEETMEKEKKETAEKIKKIVQQCRATMDPKTTSPAAIDACLAPALTLNPDDPDAQALHNEAERYTSERAVSKVQKAGIANEARKLQVLYDKAQVLVQKKKIFDALDALKTVTLSKLPDPHGLKAKAQRQRQEIIDGLSQRQQELAIQAEQAKKENRFRDAVIALQQALDINPENEVVKGELGSAMLELRKQMQPIYQESIVEESVGDVEKAKDKWKKIMDASLPKEEYYEKSRLKLKKYGQL